MDTDVVPSRNMDVAARSIDDAFFLVNPETSELHSMNAVGQRIWELIDGRRTVADVADALAQEYDVETDVARTDAAVFIAELAGKGLVTVA